MNSTASSALFVNDTHPRLFLGPDDIPSLRAKVLGGVPARALAEILRRCERYTAPGSTDYIDPTLSKDELLEGFGGGVFNGTSDALHCLSYAHVFTGEEQWADRAIAILLAMARPGEAHPNICHSTLGGQITIAFDLLFNTMSEADRQTVHAFLREHVVAHYRKERLDNPRDHTWDLGGNTMWRNLEKYTLALAATFQPPEDRDEVARVEAMLRAGLHLGLDEGGAIYEGPGYGWRDAEWLTFMAEVLLRMGVADLWHEEPRFAGLFRHWVHLVLPGTRGQNAVCDAHRHHNGRPPLGLLLAARRMNEPVFQWAWERLGGRDSVDGIDRPAPECFPMHLGQTVLWEDDRAEALSPAEAGWPASRNSGAFGFMTMRSGWSDDDLHFSLHASGHTPGCYIHQHVDAGHFCLFAFGEAFSVDSGYGDQLGRYHSVMMPGGKEPPHAPESFGHMFFGGRPHAFAAGRGADYGCVDVGEQWECHSAFRHALLIKAPGATPYVVLLDSFNKGPDFILYRWMLNSEPGNRVEIDSASERASICGREHHLDLAWAYPGPEEYEEPHQLKLAADEIDSHVWAASDAGLGRRPRLKANLYGYNGQLLTALVPRRGEESPVRIDRLVSPNQLGFVIHHGDVTDTIVASPYLRLLDLGSISGEARMVCVRRSPDGEVLWWAAADANLVTMSGRSLLPRQPEAIPLSEKE